MKYLILIPLTFLIGCASAEFKKGAYEDPRNINLLGDDFSESDAQRMSEATIEQLVKCPRIKATDPVPYVIVGRIKNSTSEHIDMALITDALVTELDHSGKFRFIHKEGRESLEEEYQYNASGAVSAETKKSRGKQKGADYMIEGNMKSITQEVGKDKTVYYTLSTRLVNIETSVADCTTSFELRKGFKKKR